MDAEKIIAEIEWLERIFAVPDARPMHAQGRVRGHQAAWEQSTHRALRPAKLCRGIAIHFREWQ